MSHTIDDADRIFGQFTRTHQAQCGDDAQISFSGTSQVTMITCHKCDTTIHAEISAPVYMEYLSKVRGAGDMGIKKYPLPPTGQKGH